MDGQKTATAEEVKLAFDYYPVIEGQVSTSVKIKENGLKNGKIFILRKVLRAKNCLQGLSSILQIVRAFS